MPECAGVPRCSGKRLQGGEPGPSSGLRRSEVGAALQQGSDSVLQGHSHFLGGLA